MRNFSFEWIVLLLIFVLIPLANYVLERMRRRFDPPRPSGNRCRIWASAGRRRQRPLPYPPPLASKHRRRHPTAYSRHREAVGPGRRYSEPGAMCGASLSR